MKNLKKLKQRGITLIALVVTIIVLLILAGVSIQMLTGQNGILKQAQKAKDETEKQSTIEQVQMEVLGALDESGEIDKEKAKKNIQESLGLKDEDVVVSGDDIIVDLGEEKLLVDKEGNVTWWEDEETKANAPKLATGMIPIKYTGSTWVICSKDDPEWYDYDKSKWANVMLSDGIYKTSTPVGTEVKEEDLGSMFVWIPRYAYKITKGYHEATDNPEIEVKFLKGTSYSYQEGEEIYTVKNGNEAGVIDTTTGYTDFIVHPTFADGSKNEYSNGEWRKEIEGIWVAKFTAGLATTEKDTASKTTISYNKNGDVVDTSAYYPIFKGRKYAYNYMNVSQIYELSQKMSSGENPYGLTGASNSHFMKNSEWGAVAYLSVSKYGANTDATYNNDLTFNGAGGLSVTIGGEARSDKVYAVTGYVGATKNAVTNEIESFNRADTITGSKGESYAWSTSNGQIASTNGNITGLYDMNGSMWTRVAAYVNYDPNKETSLKKYNKAYGDGKSTWLVTAYPATTDTITTYGIYESYSEFSKVFGDAEWETGSGVAGNTQWFTQMLDNDNAKGPDFLRGGVWNVSTGGLFLTADGTGVAGYRHGFRVALVVE